MLDDSNHQSDAGLESLPKEFKKDIPDERCYRGNFEIGGGNYISDRPSYTPRLSHAGTLKFSHQKIGIEQEDDKSYFDHRSPDIVFHNKQ
jgi:hypothetical protein